MFAFIYVLIYRRFLSDASYVKCLVLDRFPEYQSVTTLPYGKNTVRAKEMEPNADVNSKAAFEIPVHLQ